jgi:hypothetical protein
MVHAWRGIGKTHFALGVAYAVASGGGFLKWKADKPRRVLYIDGEMPGAQIKERLAAIIASPDGRQQPPAGHFRIVTPDAQEFALPDLATSAGQEAYDAISADADLIVADNLSALSRTGPENEGESWLPIATWALARRREGRAVLFGLRPWAWCRSLSFVAPLRGPSVLPVGLELRRFNQPEETDDRRQDGTGAVA